MKIDMHIHTIYSYHPEPSDSFITPQDIVKFGKRNGLDGVVITDHMVREAGSKEIERTQKENPDFLLLRGMEYHSDSGHLLIYGVKDDEIVRKFGKYGPAQEVIDFANAQGGVVVIAHPYLSGYTHTTEDKLFNLKNYLTLEEINGTKGDSINEKAKAACRQLGLNGTGGSDAHYPLEIGEAYTMFENDIKNDADLLRELRAGRFKAHKRDDTSRNSLVKYLSSLKTF